MAAQGPTIPRATGRGRRVARLAVVLAGLSSVPVGGAAGELPSWMAGCWSGSARGATFTERWTRADPSTLIGVSHTTKGGAVTEFEFLRVVLKGGTPTYVAQPGGAPPTEFAAATQNLAEIVFANPAHDFPKRIGYRRVDATHLTAWIDGGGEGARIEYPMARVACEP